MRKTLSLAGALALALGLGACRDRPEDSRLEYSMPRPAEPSGTVPGLSKDPVPLDPITGTRPADDTGINERDRSATETTADQAGMSKSDVDIMAQIRRSVVDDDTLSTNAHNVKIVAERGVVTLKGPVASAAERDAVFAKAAAVVGADNVVNQIEIALP